MSNEQSQCVMGLGPVAFESERGSTSCGAGGGSLELTRSNRRPGGDHEIGCIAGRNSENSASLDEVDSNIGVAAKTLQFDSQMLVEKIQE